MAEKRKGMMFAKAEDDTNRKIVSMLEHKGRVLVATERGIYKIENGKMKRLEFVEKENAE